MDVTTNGTQPPALAPPPDSVEPWQAMEHAYREIQRRDGRAEDRAWRWERVALLLLGMWLLTLGILVWQFLHAQQVQAFVQVVAHDEQGRLLQMGIPQDLLSYTPPDGVWLDMLSEWVRRVRWREEDSTHARTQWRWVYRHTCGSARRLLQALEDREQPFKAGKKLVSVELKTITKTPTPASYQVLWAETSTERSQPQVKTQLWTGTFSVGRLLPATLTDAMDNRLGLCVAAWDLAPQPEGR